MSMITNNERTSVAQFSVLMSVYEKEKPEFLDESLKSILINQSMIPNELILVKDGPLTDGLEKIINIYLEKFPSILKSIAIPQNVGLGNALNIGLKECSFDLVARMDSDDISSEKRFEKQIAFLEKNPDISVVGSYIAEFYNKPQNIKFTRVTPQKHIGIKTMLKRRNPMNHVTVMFRKSDLKKAGGYKHLPYLEDYYLWARMIGNNYKLHNLKEVLVLVRTGEDMYKRRSNPEYIRSWKLMQAEMLKLKLINRYDYMINMMNIIGFIYLPSGLKENVYKFLLRKKVV